MTTIRFLCAFVAMFATAASAAPSGSYRVGYRVVHAEVDGRQLDVAVWYPTDTASAAIEYGTARVQGSAAKDAPVKPGPWPLVVFAHGYSGSGIGSATIAEVVASYGIIWAAPDLSDEVTEVRIASAPTGNIFQALRKLSDKPPNLETYGYRIAQTRATLDRLLGGGDFPVDVNRLALAGHSLGAWTVMHLAFGDSRVKAVVLYSMGELNYLYKHERFFAPEQLARLKSPAYYVYGSKERKAVAHQGPPNSEFAYRATVSPACLVEVTDGDHFVYVNREVAGRHGGSPEQLLRIGQGTASFLGYTLFGLDSRVVADECKGMP